jgi:hypothetical protein
MANTNTMTAQRVNFIEAGFDVIPLRPASKLPLRKAWEQRPTVTQWYNAPIDSNLGLRAGNGIAFIDCDDKNTPGTFENVTRWLAGLGHKAETLPIVQTASGIGRHVYVTFTGNLFGSRRNFVTAMGAGDFRYGAASYVATYPDVIAGSGEYKLLQGDITRLPVLDLHDIAALVDINKAVTEPKQDKRPSSLALAIMQGTKPERYATASDGEAGLVLSLHNSGFEYDEIKSVFESSPCLGHYADKHKAKGAREADRWLRMTHQNAVTFSQNESKTRRIIAGWIDRATSGAWNKVNDKNLYLAHAAIAYKAGRFEYSADVRSLSLSAGVGLEAVSNGNKRLTKAGGLAVVRPYAGLRATTYHLHEPPVKEEEEVEFFNTESAKVVHTLRTTCEDVYENGTQKNAQIANHDAFMNGGGRYAKGRLGRRAGEVYALLMSEALTFEDLQKRTGIPTRTLRRVLSKLQNITDYKTGEVIDLVTRGGDGAYCSNLVDLDVIAAIVRTYGATGKRRKEYNDDRRDRARAWELDTLKKR